MANVINLNKDETIEQLKAKLYDARQTIRGLNAKKHSGVIKLKEDPVKYQKKIRDEWN